MIGQGGPKASRARVARHARAMPWLCLAALAWCVCCVAAASSASADEATLQLRIAWGGGVERMWHGSIRVSDGELSEIEPLGIEADESGSIWLEDGAIEIRQRSLRAYDGIDVLVTADLEAQLSITLADGESEISKKIEVPLKTLVSQSNATVLDEAGNRLLVSRSPSDRLRISIERQTLIFAPGEMFPFQIEPYLLDQGGAKVRFSAQITSNPAGQRVWSEEYDSGPEGTSTAITIKVPDAEGVYDLSIAATQSSRLRRLNLKKSLAERKIQFVVLDPKSQNETGQAQLTKIVEIDPVNPRWWERFAAVPWIPGLRRGPLGNGDAAAWEHPKLGPMIQLGPGGAVPNVSWEAYPLPIANPGQPHVLEIEYPSDVPQSMGISLIEPNAAGAVSPIGLDSGVYVSDEEAENTPQLARHRVVFWPRTKTPLLLITNRREGSRAVYGKISVLGTSHSQFPMLSSLSRAEAASALPPAFANHRPPDRLWAGYLDRPLFVENFSAPEALDSTSHRSLDDWNTFYQGGTRLVKYLKHVGYSGLMMSAFADGSAIYPSQVVQSTPRYDTGVFFATGQDPRRKDVLEMLFRLFDREGLTLIPALQFAAPLADLEELLRQGGPPAVGLEWIGADGRPWLASNTPRQGLAPYYNLLDPRVQEAMLEVAREVVSRYSAHESFGGVSLQLSADGYAQLPGEDWGYDDRTIARFEQETNSQVPGEGEQRFAARAKHLRGPGRAAWTAWRARTVGDFHRRLQEEIGSRHKGAKLYLAGATMLDNRQTQYRLRPTLPRRAKLDEAMLELGIRAASYHDEQDIVLLRPQHIKPPAGASPAQSADWEINLAPGEMDRLFGGGSQAASLFYHEPQKVRLASFDAKSPFGPANTYTWLVSEMSPSGDRNRRRFVHSLATLDAQEMFDGGWLLPLGQETALHDILSVYRLLPRERFETLPGEHQPVTIRTLVRDRQTYVYFVNDSPWEITLTMGVDLPRDCRMEKLGESRGIGTIGRTTGEAPWKVTLRPYDLVAARFSSAQVRFRQPQTVISEQVRLGLQRRIRDLGARVAALGNPQPVAVLANSSFEFPLEDGAIPGWVASADEGGNVALDPTQKRSGGQSLKLATSGRPVKVTSAPFAPPTTGRLAVEVWLRSADPTERPSVRISVEGALRDARFDPFGIIPQVGRTAANTGDWVRYSFPLDYLPGEGLSELRLGFELLGAGEVWVDDVQIFDLAFSEAERYELSKLISLASVVLEKGQLADCSQLLDGYWPQFLVSHVPLTQANTPVAQRPRDNRAASAPPAPMPAAPKKPTMMDNLRDYLPRMPRR